MSLILLLSDTKEQVGQKWTATQCATARQAHSYNHKSYSSSNYNLK